MPDTDPNTTQLVSSRAQSRVLERQVEVMCDLLDHFINTQAICGQMGRKPGVLQSRNATLCLLHRPRLISADQSPENRR
ncbi:hypothetical protein GOOTI_057_00010 [Gordonia otitidis NBRC 100426]|uniref:Uncharacterized protein n=1 Tax=Gordonia otitidis (strain DSM 44809 / CCUG 52243 / JCM 12355 / NBRC 100426 / IFM 10032) TaxID=1108044 RepID=H5TIF2_GORO1|nr:hypothetical protein GOOTI_057_00010 [Gordonia otitidis NBRC 100426]